MNKTIEDVRTQAGEARYRVWRVLEELSKSERDCGTIVNNLIAAQGAIEAALTAYLTD